jgi:nucleoside-diphosphate-sugar epimerase
LTEDSPQTSLVDSPSQFVIYGANGWMGRSAVEYLLLIEPKIAQERLLLIGSGRSKLSINGRTFKILDPISGFSYIEENSVFLNSAFLRRESLITVPAKEYVRRNLEISSFAKRALEKRKLFSFINLSSGAARNMDIESNHIAVDDYARIKKSLEIEFSELASENKTPFVNCRIYSLSGRYLNEFENLALSSFIKQAQGGNQIKVKSPSTKRTYLDATNLAAILFNIACKGYDAYFDSGGTLVTMSELARNVANALGKKDCEILYGGDQSPDYFGDYESFNKLATELGVEMFGVQEQILRTLEAFN